MARRRKRSLPDRYRSQAELEARIRSAPQRRTLEAALTEAQGNRDASIEAAHGTSRGLRASLRAARPAFDRIYDRAGGQLANQNAVVAPNTAAGSAIATAAATEHQAALGANTAAQAAAQADVRDQIVRAREGEAFAVRQARSQYQGDASKILQQLLGVSEDEGDYAAATLGRLVEGARGRAVTRRGQDLSHQDRVADRRARERTAAAKERASRWLPQGDQNDAHDTIRSALDIAKDFVGHASRQEAARALRQGVKDQTVENLPVMDPATGKQRVDPKTGVKLYRDPDSGKLTTKAKDSIPGVPQFKQDAYVQAALDMAYDGHLSRRTQALLHKQGIKVRGLGLVTYQQWRRRNRQPPASGGQPSMGAAGYPYGPGAGQVR